MSNKTTPGTHLRQALNEELPLQVAGAINAYCALLAERAGFRAIYLSGAGVANASLGLPDLGVTTLEDVLTDVGRITRATPLPLLVDVDTGWEEDEGIARTTQAMIQAGAAGLQMEDQVSAKRCGHRPGKQLVTTEAMVKRIQEAVAGRTDPGFVIMARTDAAANEGMEGALARAGQYVEAGADIIFAEALTELDQYREFTREIKVPVLANITEFGKTPLFTLDELREAGVAMVLYPLSAFRAMNAAAVNVYETIRNQGTQKSLLTSMQTRDELYETLDYLAQEQKIDQLNSGNHEQ